MERVKMFVRMVSDMLGIEQPPVEFDLVPVKTGNLASLEVEFEKTKIHLAEKFENKMDMYFAIAHELRHSYQIQKTPELLKGTLDIGDRGYNMHPSEIDANAFASLVCQKIFGAKPLFLGLDEEEIAEIRKREEELKKEGIV